jgi:pimeloyl-ACP methyl ester carboxylesterase
MSAPIPTYPSPSTALMLMEGRALAELGAYWLLSPWLAMSPRGDGHPVIVLPGLLADDTTTRPLRSFLNSHGYKAHGWKQGRNCGLRGNLQRHMLERVGELFERHGRRKVSLVGWSLGGLYARLLAKLVPDKVRCVISLGSPFGGTPKSTNAWRVYELVSGSQAEDHEALEFIAEPPPVPTTSIFSRTDGVCAWQACLNEEGPEIENIEIDSSHCGLGHHPAAIYAIADRLSQAEGHWRKFDRHGWRRFVFPESSGHTAAPKDVTP